MFGRCHIALLFSIVAGAGCRPDDPDTGEQGPSGHEATPYALDVPANFPPFEVPADNPLTVEGVLLGRYLFYEERLSGNDQMSCASCHAPAVAFSDSPEQFSTGIDGSPGTRNAMALMNLAWEDRFFWDGRAHSLEEQVLFPVRDPVEMHETWTNAVSELQHDPAYVALYEAAFGSTLIESLGVAKALAQFLRSMVSSNSRFDKWQRGELDMTPEEDAGLGLINAEGGPGFGGADCFHCHPHTGQRFTDGAIRNNGLDSVLSDPGLGGITGLPQDMGKFKTPSLRNVALTAPYMHDGRFATLQEVIEHYTAGGLPSPTIDPNMEAFGFGLSLTPEKKAHLLAFLNALTDEEFVNDPRFADPGTP